MPPEPGHPLDALSAEEIAAAVALVRADARFPASTRFAHVALSEPPKEVVRAHTEGSAVDRAVRMVLVTGPEPDVLEVEVSLT
ncbi:MAG TPA: hypothetical protein VMU09_00890, partial [Acidimicrobiales bacterium]|nr:hypothetical protein [Acidimicrobiales bacterium]